MTAQFIGARVPICDANFIVEPIWYRLFSRLFDTSGSGSVGDDTGNSVAPIADQGLYAMLANAGADDVTPAAAMQFAAPIDDVSPAFALLQSEVAELRAQIDDLRKGITA